MQISSLGFVKLTFQSLVLIYLCQQLWAQDTHDSLTFTMPTQFNLVQTMLGTVEQKAYVSEQWNYSISGPRGFQYYASPKQINPVYDVVYLQGNQCISGVIVEDLAGVINDTKQLDAACRAQFPGQAMSHSEEMMAGELKGMSFHRTTTHNQVSYVSYHWCYCHLGRCYQINVFGPTVRNEFLKTAFKEFVSSFSIVNLDTKHGIDYADTETGVTVKLPHNKWVLVEDLGDYKNYFNFGLSNGNSTYFLFIRFPYRDLSVGDRDIESLMLSLLSVPETARIKRSVSDGRNIGEFKLSSRGVSEHWAFFHKKDENDILCGIGWTTIDTHKSELLQICESADIAKESTAGPIASRVLSFLGLIYEGDGRINKAIACHKLAIATDPIVGAYQHLAQLYDRQQNDDQMLTVLKEGIQNHPKDQTLKALYCIALAESGKLTEAKEQMAQLLDKEGYYEKDFIERMFGIFYQHDVDDAITLLKKFLEKSNDPTLAVLLVYALAETEAYEEAESVLENSTSFLTTQTTAISKSFLFRAKKQYDLARAVIKEYQDKEGEGIDDVLASAKIEIAVKDFEKARALAEKAYEMDPHNKTAQETLLHIKALLGEGSRVGIVDNIPSVKMPDVKMDYQVPEDAQGYYAKRKHMAIKFDPGVDHRVTELNTFVVVDVNGLRELSQLEVDYDPLLEDICINRIQVMNESGEVTWSGEPGSYYQLDKNERGIAHYEKTVHIPVKGLRVGDTVELQFTKRMRNAPEIFPFRFWMPRDARFACDVMLWVDEPEESVVIDNPGRVHFERVEGAYLFRVNNMKKFDFEDRMANWVEELPVVFLGSNKKDWKSLTQSYLKELSSHLTDDARINLLDIEGTDLQQCYRAVQDAIAYNAIAFGDRARIPQSITDIQTGRKGDCKDHSLLLWHILRRKGYKAHLALVSKWDYFAEKIPSLDQFDHMIVVCEMKKGQYVFLDATDKTVPLGKRCPVGLLGKQCLILNEQAESFKITDDVSRDTITVLSELTLENDGDGTFNDAITLHGYMADSMRNVLDPIDDKSRRIVIERILSHDMIRLDDMEIEHLKDHGEPLVIKLNYKVFGLMVEKDDFLIGRAMASWPSYILRAYVYQERQYSFEFKTASSVEWDLKVKAPSGTWETSLNAKWENDFFSFSQHASADKSTLHVKGQCVRAKGVYGPQQYERFYKSSVDVLKACHAPLIFKRKQ